MDRNIEELLKDKVGFFKKLFKPMYTVDTVKEAFSLGQAKYKTIANEIQVKYDSVNKTLGITTKDNNKLHSELKAKKSLNTDLSNQVTKLNETVSALEVNNKELTKKVTTLTQTNLSLKQELKDSTKAKDIKVLEQKLKDQESKFAKEKSKLLKDCTDDFMKTINKQDKEIARLTKLVEKSPKSKPKKDSHKTDGKVNGQPAFTCEQVVKIRKEYKEGKNTTQLASEYNVNRSTIDRMVQGKTYKKCK